MKWRVAELRTFVTRALESAPKRRPTSTCQKVVVIGLVVFLTLLVIALLLQR